MIIVSNEKEEIVLDGEKIEVIIKMKDEEKEDNNLRKYLDDTIDLNDVIGEVKNE